MSTTKLLRALSWDLVTGKPTGLPDTIRKAVTALEAADVPYAITGAVALGVRGCVRTTMDVDILVLADDLPAALVALSEAGFHGDTEPGEDVEPQYVLEDPATEATIDILVGFGEPEYSLLTGATRAAVAGTRAVVARREHLLLSYLYSNQPRHLGDFAALVQQGKVNRAAVRRLLRDLHPEMLPTFEARWDAAESPPPAPARPTRPRPTRRSVAVVHGWDGVSWVVDPDGGRRRLADCGVEAARGRTTRVAREITCARCARRRR